MRNPSRLTDLRSSLENEFLFYLIGSLWYGCRSAVTEKDKATGDAVLRTETKCMTQWVSNLRYRPLIYD
jgi:hypothetical protein